MTETKALYKEFFTGIAGGLRNRNRPGISAFSDIPGLFGISLIPIQFFTGSIHETILALFCIWGRDFCNVPPFFSLSLPFLRRYYFYHSHRGDDICDLFAEYPAAGMFHLKIFFCAENSAVTVIRDKIIMQLNSIM